MTSYFLVSSREGWYVLCDGQETLSVAGPFASERSAFREMVFIMNPAASREDARAAYEEE